MRSAPWTSLETLITNELVLGEDQKASFGFVASMQQGSASSEAPKRNRNGNTESETRALRRASQKAWYERNKSKPKSLKSTTAKYMRLDGMDYWKLEEKDNRKQQEYLEELECYENYWMYYEEGQPFIELDFWKNRCLLCIVLQIL